MSTESLSPQENLNEARQKKRSGLLNKFLSYGIALMMGLGTGVEKLITEKTDNLFTESDRKVSRTEMLKQLRVYYGDFMSEIDGLKDNIRQRPEQDVRIEFIKESELDPLFLRQIIGRMPQNWSSEIDSIVISDDEVLNKSGDKVAGEINRVRRSITLYENSLTPDQLLRWEGVIFHEFGHFNDWASDSNLSLDEKIEMLWQMTQRYFSPGRTIYVYVEDIQEDGDKFKTNYRKIIEYWGTLCEIYFKNPSQLAIEDFQLVDRYVLKNDPEYHNSPHFKSVMRPPSLITQDGEYGY